MYHLWINGYVSEQKLRETEEKGGMEWCDDVTEQGKAWLSQFLNDFCYDDIII